MQVAALCPIPLLRHPQFQLTILIERLDTKDFSQAQLEKLSDLTSNRIIVVEIWRNLKYTNHIADLVISHCAHRLIPD